MSRVSLAVAALAMTVLLVGCGTQSGKTVVKYEKGSTLPNITQAPDDGTYALYSTWDTTAITSFALNKGDRLGFDHGAGDQVVAVAGNNTYPVKTTTMTGSYYWKRQK